MFLFPLQPSPISSPCLWPFFWRVDIWVCKGYCAVVCGIFYEKKAKFAWETQSSIACINRNIRHNLLHSILQIHICAAISCTGTIFFSCTNTNHYLTALRLHLCQNCVIHLLHWSAVSHHTPLLETKNITWNCSLGQKWINDIIC